jgi:hypothetical protein
MKPSLAEVQRRLSLPVTEDRACRHRWLMRSKIIPARGGGEAVRYRCDRCGRLKFERVSPRFARREET